MKPCSPPIGVISGSRLIEGNFPKYRSLLPESYPNRIELAKEALLEALGAGFTRGRGSHPGAYAVDGGRRRD